MSDVLVLNCDGTPLSQIPLSVVPWQVALRLHFSEKARVIKEYNNWVVRSQYLTINVPSIIIMTEQVKWRRTVKYNRMNVYLRDNFTCQLQATHKCKTLGGKVKISDLTLDHVVPKSQGGKTNWVNVCTSCKDCNSYKGNNSFILPKTEPRKPTYYELLAKRKTLPIYIKDAEWKYYLDWPDELIKLSKERNDYD